MKPYRVLLYYGYSSIENPDQYREEHHLLCLRLNLLGRVIVAAEGLNGTVSGLIADCDAYMTALRADSRFADIDVKVDESDNHTFHKLRVRVKNEIVHSDLPVDPLRQTGIHLGPEQFRQLRNDPDVVLVDMRSNYEHVVGKFRNAVTFDMANLRNLPDHIHEIDHLKDKTIITYCTGGVKCEKASAYLLSQGFENVYQLHGGIIDYGLKAEGDGFDGQCYVFDNRLTVTINHVDPTVMSTCCRCETPTSRMVNCASPLCHNHVILCETCGYEHGGTCADSCKEDPNLRHYDGTGRYGKQAVGYTPAHGYESRKGEKRVNG